MAIRVVNVSDCHIFNVMHVHRDSGYLRLSPFWWTNGRIHCATEDVCRPVWRMTFVWALGDAHSGHSIGSSCAAVQRADAHCGCLNRGMTCTHIDRVIGDWWTRKNCDKADQHIKAAVDDGWLSNTSSKLYHICQQQDWADVIVYVI